MKKKQQPEAVERKPPTIEMYQKLYTRMHVPLSKILAHTRAGGKITDEQVFEFARPEDVQKFKSESK